MNNESIESVTTTAGLAGFIVLFSLAIACWVIFRGMNKRLRGIRYRELEEERRAQAERAAAADQQPEPEQTSEAQQSDPVQPFSGPAGGDRPASHR